MMIYFAGCTFVGIIFITFVTKDTTYKHIDQEPEEQVPGDGENKIVVAPLSKKASIRIKVLQSFEDKQELYSPDKFKRGSTLQLE